MSNLYIHWQVRQQIHKIIDFFFNYFYRKSWQFCEILNFFLQICQGYFFLCRQIIKKSRQRVQKKSRNLENHCRKIFRWISENSSSYYSKSHFRHKHRSLLRDWFSTSQNPYRNHLKEPIFFAKHVRLYKQLNSLAK